MINSRLGENNVLFKNPPYGSFWEDLCFTQDVAKWIALELKGKMKYGGFEENAHCVLVLTSTNHTLCDHITLHMGRGLAK